MALNTYSFLVALNGLNIRQDISVTDYDTKYTAMLSDAMSFLNSKIFFTKYIAYRTARSQKNFALVPKKWEENLRKSSFTH